MKWMLWIVFLTLTTTIALAAETVTTKTTTNGAQDRQPPDFCRTNPNPYTKEACQQIRQSERVRNNPDDPNNTALVIQNKTVEQSGDSNSMPAWQQALQPPATTTTK